ncbi:MAG: hypothetical protein WBJ10_17085 [Daejeonella sp.]|uniref:hypothetical protein n=1 Tax=Daejeonella sp. TaxID=2805397 RepID=UPI003C75176B
MLFEISYEDLITDQFDEHQVAARILGRQMQVILNDNEMLRSKILRILASRLNNFTSQEIDSMYNSADKSDTQIIRYKSVDEVIKGIEE